MAFAYILEPITVPPVLQPKTCRPVVFINLGDHDHRHTVIIIIISFHTNQINGTVIQGYVTLTATLYFYFIILPSLCMEKIFFYQIPVL